MESELELLQRHINAVTFTPSQLESEMDDLIARKSSDGVASLALLRVLTSEILRFKAQETSLKASLERADRDNVKSEIMLNLLQDQVAHSNVNVERMKADLRTAQESAAKLTEQNKRLSEQLKESVEAEQHVKRLLEQEVLSHQKNNDAKEAKVSYVETTLDALKKELDMNKVRYLKLVQESEQKSKEAFQQEVTLKVALNQAKEDAEHLTGTLRKDVQDALERAVMAEQRLKHTMHELSSTKARNLEEQKAQHELVAVLKTELETTKLLVAQKDAMISANTKETFEKMAKLQLEVDRLKEDLTAERNMAEASRKQHDVMVEKYKAENNSFQLEVTRLSTELITKQKNLMDTQVNARVEAEGLRSRITGAETDRDHFRNKFKEMEAKLKAENEGLRRTTRDEVRVHDTEVAALKDEITKLNSELRVTSRRLGEVETVLSEKEKQFSNSYEEHKKEVTTLRAEIAGYKQSVRQLEAHIAENISYKILQEKCESLESDLVSARNQVSHLGHVIAEMKVESEVVEQYRVRLLQERYDDLTKEMDLLRSQARFCLPLLDDTLTILQKEVPGKITGAMLKEIDLYQREFCTIPAALSVYSVS
eukprot:PhF_6_TR37928/c0_g1_i1/m.56679